MENLNNETIIKNISTDQSEILLNIMNLYNEGKPFECDITASELKYKLLNENNIELFYYIPKNLLNETKISKIYNNKNIFTNTNEFLKILKARDIAYMKKTKC